VSGSRQQPQPTRDSQGSSGEWFASRSRGNYAAEKLNFGLSPARGRSGTSLPKAGEDEFLRQGYEVAVAIRERGRNAHRVPPTPCPGASRLACR